MQDVAKLQDIGKLALALWTGGDVGFHSRFLKQIREPGVESVLCPAMAGLLEYPDPFIQCFGLSVLRVLAGHRRRGLFGHATQIVIRNRK